MMDKQKMQASNLIDRNIEQITKLSPNVMAETKNWERHRMIKKATHCVAN